MIESLRPMRIVAVAVLACLLATLALSVDARAAGEYELNDTRDTAFGPLTGGTDYTATFETENDVDWYLFYVKAYSQLDFSATSVSSGCGGSGGGAHLILFDKDGKGLSVSGEEGFFAGRINETNHLRLTLPAGRYYIEVHNHGCVNDRYRFRIDPATALTSSRVCGEAIVARETISPALAKVVGEINKNSEALAVANAKLRTAKATLKRLKRHRASRYSKQRARQRIVAAQTARGKVLEQRVALQTLGAQYTAQKTQAEGTIASSC